MEGTDELRAKATASMATPANPNSELSNKPSKAKEEGELSSSEGEQLPAHPVKQPTSTAAPAVEPVPVAPVNKYTQGVKAGKSISVSNRGSSVDIQSRPSLHLNYHKNFEKNRVPPKSSTSVWHPPPLTDDNLVIRFSDDDSSSDSEQEKALESKGNTVGINGNRRPPTSSLPKSEMLRRATRNETRPVPKRTSLTRTFVKSMTKINGANSSGARTSLMEQGIHSRNFALNRNLADPERGRNQVAGLDNSKLQDLREQIAIRESELKLKSAQQNKDPVLSSCKDYTGMSLTSDAARKDRAASADILQAEAKEPDKKRLKVSSTYSSQPIPDKQPIITTAKYLVALKDRPSENSGPCNKNNIVYNHSNEEIHSGRLQDEKGVAAKRQKKDDKCMDVSLMNPPNGNDGSRINANCSQSDRNARQEDPISLLNQIAPIVNTASNTIPKELVNHPTKIIGHHPSSSFPSRETSKRNLIRSNEYGEVTSGDKSNKSISDNVCQGRPLMVQDSRFKTSNVSLNNTSLWNGLGNVNVSGSNNIRLQSLHEIEDLHDKELEEAQEYRRRCEIEERNALKAYRKAQRALIEANAICNNLYRKRELYSARIQSLIAEDSNLMWSSCQHEHGGVELNSSYNMSEGHMDLIPRSSHQLQAEFDVSNRRGFVTNITHVNSAPLNTSYRHVDGQNLGSEPCSEPDGSTSELMPLRGKSAAKRDCSPSSDPNVSADEDDTFSFDHEFIQPNPEHQRRESFEEIEKEIIDNSRRKNPEVSTQESLLLEASLRSELFARLGMRSSLKNSDCAGHGVESAVERGAENDVSSEKSQMTTGWLRLAEAEMSQPSDVRGNNRLEKTITEVPVQNHNQCVSHATTDPEENIEGQQSRTSVTFSPFSILKSAFGHMKVASPTSFVRLQSREQHNNTNDKHIEEGTGVSSDEVQMSGFIVNSVQETVRDIFAKETGSYICDLAVDPFWPLCMYELRGKCNDEKCPWQHVNDYSSGIKNQNRSVRADCQVGSSSHRAKSNAQSIGESWQKSFSMYLTVSRLLQRGVPVDEPFLHGRDGRNRQSSYFQSGNGALNQFNRDFGDNLQAMEVALLVLNQEVNKSEGNRKALSVLSRALESDRASVLHWIVYLLVYYSNTTSIGKDDMFDFAVKFNEGSYELWLLFINSRPKLNDRLTAYDSALSALCHKTSDSEHSSACILDLFLQMVDCFCMSSAVNKAITRVHGLFPSSKNSNEPHSLLLSEILGCLTISDKSIFWVCCVYLVIYRKLPDAVVQQFECEKDVFSIRWPSVELRDEEKHQALKFIEMAVSSFESNIENKTTLRSVHMFALSHVRCMVALQGLQNSKNLLEKYIKSYPSCLELVLMSARVDESDSGDLKFAGFEEAILNWPKEVPGIQCIWNQYVEYVLQKGRIDVAKELMLRWVKSEYPKIESASSADFSKQSDLMFGFLNLSLHQLLLNDQTEARLAIDKALKSATPDNYKHCVKEHALFFLTSENSEINDLKNYLSDSQVCPFSRKFISDIEKPRIRQLITNLLSPISSDSSLVNSVLEVWYGSSLLPEKFNKQKELVDFVESVMEIVPSNYELAFSVCKRLSREFNPKDIGSVGVLFWANSVLVNAIFEAVPVPPERVWVEGCQILGYRKDIRDVSEMFHKRGLLVYPFSVKLWKSYLELSKFIGKKSSVVEAAREKGMKLE